MQDGRPQDRDPWISTTNIRPYTKRVCVRGRSWMSDSFTLLYSSFLPFSYYIAFLEQSSVYFMSRWSQLDFYVVFSWLLIVPPFFLSKSASYIPLIFSYKYEEFRLYSTIIQFEVNGNNVSTSYMVISFERTVIETEVIFFNCQTSN